MRLRTIQFPAGAALIFQVCTFCQGSAPTAPGLMLPAGGNTIAGPGFTTMPWNPGAKKVLLSRNQINATGTQEYCVTIANLGGSFPVDAFLEGGTTFASTPFWAPGDTFTQCMQTSLLIKNPDFANVYVSCGNETQLPSPGKNDTCAFFWRVDIRFVPPPQN